MGHECVNRSSLRLTFTCWRAATISNCIGSFFPQQRQQPMELTEEEVRVQSCAFQGSFYQQSDVCVSVCVCVRLSVRQHQQASRKLCEVTTLRAICTTSHVVIPCDMPPSISNLSLVSRFFIASRLGDGICCSNGYSSLMIARTAVTRICCDYCGVMHFQERHAHRW